MSTVLFLTLILITVTKSRANDCFTNKEAYQINYQNVDSIRDSCGEICDTDLEIERGSEAAKFYRALKKNFDCEAVWTNPLIDEPSRFCEPPKKIPKRLMPHFTYNGRIGVKEFYFGALVPSVFDVSES